MPELRPDRQRHLIEVAPDAVLVVAQGRVSHANPAAARLFGTESAEDLVGEPLVVLFDDGAYRDILARALAGSADLSGARDPFTVRIARSAGEEVPCEAVVVATGFRARPATVIFLRDLSHLREAELRHRSAADMAEDPLRQEEARYRSLFEHSPAALVEMDLQAVVGWMDRLRARGVTDLADHLARHPGDLRLGISRIRVTRANRRALDLLEAGSEEELLGDINPDRFDAEMLWGMGTQLAALWAGEETHQVELALTTRKETPIVCRVRWAVPVCIGEPDWSRAVLVLEDVTERRAAEAALVEALDAQGDFIASVAHQLRTPLTAVLGFSEVLEEGWQALPPEEREELIGLVARSAVEAAGVLDDLFVAARGRIDVVTVSPRAVDLGRELGTVWSALPPELAARVELPEVRVTLMADPPRLRQVLRNLCLAADRSPEVRVWMAVEEVAAAVWVRVCHDGPPLPEGRRRLLEEAPGPRSLSVSDLGLRVARQLTVLMGGTLRYRTSAMQSAFELLLPIPPEGSPIDGGGSGGLRRSPPSAAGLPDR